MGKQDDVIIISDDDGIRKKIASEVKRPNSLINRPKSDVRITDCILGLRAPKAAVGSSDIKTVLYRRVDSDSIVCIDMEKCFFSQKRRGRGNGAKEKNILLSGVVVKNKDFVIEERTAAPNVGLRSYPTLSEAYGHSSASVNENDVGTVNIVANSVTIVGPTSVGNGVVASLVIKTSTPGKSNSYVNVTREPRRKRVNFRTLITPEGNKVDVVVQVESIRAISERFANTTYGFFLGKQVAYPISSMKGLDAMLENGSWFIPNNSLILKKSSYAREMIELQENMELKDTIMVDMPRLDEFPKYISSNMAKNLKNPSQAPKGVPVGPNVGFKPVKHVFRPIYKKNNGNTSGNNNKYVESRK
ncbi:hypothetical protein Tco_1563183 [Tanacetum coccineum]